MRCARRKRKGKLRAAYFTAEMALVFPIVLFVIALLLHFTFYLYGRCILSQDVYLLAFRASLADEEALGTDRASYLRQIADAQFGRKYFGNRKPALTVEANADEVRLGAETEASHRAMSGSPLMPVGAWTHGAKARAEIVDPAARIRRLARLGDIAKELYEKTAEK